MKRHDALMLACAALLSAEDAQAKPPGPQTLCETYPDAAVCAAAVPDCRLCHVQAGPPARNPFGACIEQALAPGEPRPLSDGDFADALPAALHAIEGDDCDGDGVASLDELMVGTHPGDAASVPAEGDCLGTPNPDYDVCAYDPRYAYKKVHLDFCGRSPSYEQMQDFLALERDAQMQHLHDTLDACFDGELWIGKDGIVWSLAHRKIRPISGLKGGIEDIGSLPVLGDYYDDYALFVYAHTDGRDARAVLTADYYVKREEQGGHTQYLAIADKCETPCGLDGQCIIDCATGNQLVEPERRAGLLTTRWNLLLNTMFTDVPRTNAAQAYRAWLGLDIAKMEGLQPIAGEPVDYDDKGVARQECAVCHSTLDPLTYPFTTYSGFGDSALAQYLPARMDDRGLGEVPESGYLMGQPVADLLEWAEIAANSDAFAHATVLDYWRLFMNSDPTESQLEELDRLSDDFKHAYGHDVERMLHDFIETEAYGAP